MTDKQKDGLTKVLVFLDTGIIVEGDDPDDQIAQAVKKLIMWLENDPDSLEFVIDSVLEDRKVDMPEYEDHEQEKDYGCK